jgi:non-specific serine/threonine protein kinase
MAMTQGDAAAARPVLDEAEVNARGAGDLSLVARILAVSAGVRVMAGDLEGAQSQLRDARALADGLDDPGAEAMLALTEGFIALLDTDLETVARVYSEWAPRARDRGDIQTLSYLVSSYGFALLQGGQPDKARPLFEESLSLERRLENRDMIVYQLDALACQAAMVGRHQRAARLMGAAERMQAETGIRLMLHMEPLLARARESVSASLGPEAFQSEAQAGRGMDRDEAIAYALEEKKPRPAPASKRTSTTSLSKREVEIAQLVAQGLSNKEIATRVFLSERTIETHVSNILDKLGVNSRVEISSWVARELTPN